MIDETRWQKLTSRTFQIRGVGQQGTVTLVKQLKKGFFTFVTESVNTEEWGDRFETEEAAKQGAEKEIGKDALSKSALYFLDREWN